MQLGVSPDADYPQISASNLDTDIIFSHRQYSYLYLFFMKIDLGKTYKKGRGAKLQVIKGRITSTSPLRFLEKCASKNLISARSLYPFDDAIDQVMELSPNKTPFSLSSGNRRTKYQ